MTVLCHQWVVPRPVYLLLPVTNVFCCLAFTAWSFKLFVAVSHFILDFKRRRVDHLPDSYQVYFHCLTIIYPTEAKSSFIFVT